ncbi:hypothetical protein BH10PLA1_BH10PLA1_15450 [soil metagenome]
MEMVRKKLSKVDCKEDVGPPFELVAREMPSLVEQIERRRNGWIFHDPPSLKL